MNRKQRRAEGKPAKAGGREGQARPDTIFAMALQCHGAGKLPEAERYYREVIAIAENAEAYSNLGIVLKAMGRLDEAVAAYRSAIRIRPQFAGAYFNLGNALNGKGLFDEAIAAYRHAVALRPNYAEAYCNLGGVLKDRGLAREAVQACMKAIEARPEYAEAHSNLGNALKADGRYDEAMEAYKVAIRLRPDYPEAHYNLANALRDMKRLPEAIASYEQALTLRPAYPEARINLASALLSMRAGARALDHIVAALQLRESPEAKALFVSCMSGSSDWMGCADLRLVRALLLRALSEPWGRPADLGCACIDIIRRGAAKPAGAERAPAEIERPLRELFGEAHVGETAQDPLVIALLRSGPITDGELERGLTEARRAMLDAADAESAPHLALELLAFYAALAQQCFLNEYVFRSLQDEFALAVRLRDRVAAAIAAGSVVSSLALAATAAYFPLYSLPAAAGLLARAWPDPLRELLAQQISEPMQELAIRAAVPSLTSIDHEVSLIVRQQYEENPYPRWERTAPTGRPLRITDYLRAKFPLAAFRPLESAGDTEVLIAGCGTGQHPVETAMKLSGTRILGIDLSRTSLAYAQRKTMALGFTNIEYGQGDILHLPSLGREFDLIESAGVLHHLRDPLKGWRTLLSILRPGGVMAVALYSELARRHIVAARSFILEKRYADDPESIRCCRQELLGLHASHPLSRVTESTDFFSTSSCRDLLFHVQEHRFTIPQIAAFLAKQDLLFIGFEIDPQIQHDYSTRFPDDPALADLEKWNIFERENPNTFAAMYQFWIQKRG